MITKLILGHLSLFVCFYPLRVGPVKTRLLLLTLTLALVIVRSLIFISQGRHCECTWCEGGSVHADTEASGSWPELHGGAGQCGQPRSCDLHWTQPGEYGEICFQDNYPLKITINFYTFELVSFFDNYKYIKGEKIP